MQVKQKVESFFGKYPTKMFKKGEILIFAGDAPSNIFSLLAGNVRQYDVAANGDEVVMNIFKPPAFFPMNYVINRRPNDYIYDATTNVSAHVAPLDEVLSFVRNNSDVTFDLLSRVYNGIDGVLRRQFYLMSSNASDRLLYELVLCCRRFGDPKPDNSYLVKLTETELAARVGLSRETVSRRLQTLKKEGLVRTKVDGLLVTDIAAIEKLLEDRSSNDH